MIDCEGVKFRCCSYGAQEFLHSDLMRSRPAGASVFCGFRLVRCRPLGPGEKLRRSAILIEIIEMVLPGAL